MYSRYVAISALMTIRSSRGMLALMLLHFEVLLSLLAQGNVENFNTRSHETP